MSEGHPHQIKKDKKNYSDLIASRKALYSSNNCIKISADMYMIDMEILQFFITL